MPQNISKKIVISVVIPAYNAGKHLGFCLNALNQQTIDSKLYELIVVSDGSTDDTVSIAESYGAKVFCIDHQGPAAARNFGALKAYGEIIVFTDADCIPEKRWIENMVEPFQDPTVSGVMGRYKTHQKHLTARFAQAEFEDRYQRMRNKRQLDLVATYSAAYRKNIFIDSGGFDTSFTRADNEDVEFSYRLARGGHILRFSPHAVVYHHHPESIRQYFKQKLSRAAWRVVVYSFHPEKAIKDSYTPASLKIQIILIWFVITSFLIIPFIPGTLILAIMLPVIFILSCLTFIANIWHHNSLIALISPFFLGIRSLAFSLGIVKGFFLIYSIKSSRKKRYGSKTIQ